MITIYMDGSNDTDCSLNFTWTVSFESIDQSGFVDTFGVWFCCWYFCIITICYSHDSTSLMQAKFISRINGTQKQERKYTKRPQTNLKTKKNPIRISDIVVNRSSNWCQNKRIKWLNLYCGPCTWSVLIFGIVQKIIEEMSQFVSNWIFPSESLFVSSLETVYFQYIWTAVLVPQQIMHSPSVFMLIKMNFALSQNWICITNYTKIFVGIQFSTHKVSSIMHNISSRSCHSVHDRAVQPHADLCFIRFSLSSIYTNKLRLVHIRNSIWSQLFYAMQNAALIRSWTINST